MHALEHSFRCGRRAVADDELQRGSGIRGLAEQEQEDASLAGFEGEGGLQRGARVEPRAEAARVL